MQRRKQSQRRRPVSHHPAPISYHLRWPLQFPPNNPFHLACGKILNQTVCADLFLALQSHTCPICAEKTLTAEQILTSSSFKIRGVLLADPAVAHGKKGAPLREKLFDFVEPGGTVVCAGVFAGLVSPGLQLFYFILFFSEKTRVFAMGV